MNDLANIRAATVGDGNQLDQLGAVDVFGFSRSEGGFDVDIPLADQPREGVGGDDRAKVDKGPFGRLDVMVVVGGRVVDCGKGRIGGEEGPRVGFEVGWERVVQRREGDLRGVHEGCPTIKSASQFLNVYDTMGEALHDAGIRL